MGEVGAVKLKDGLFFGDSMAAQDIDFVVANKVMRIVNCASREVVNQFESLGVEYLSFPWADNDGQVILDPQNQVLVSVSRFIDETLDQGLSVLVHSFRGRSRCVTLITAYLMKKYRWTTNKALQYVQSRRAEIGIKPAFHRQLLVLERKLATMHTLSNTWDRSHNSEDLIMCNTYLNSKSVVGIAESPKVRSANNFKRIVWTDHGSGDSGKLERASDSSGRLHLRVPVGQLKSCLKRPHRVGRINFGISAQSSPVSTAESSPVPAPLKTFIRYQSPILTRPQSVELPSPKPRVTPNPTSFHYMRQPSPMVRRTPDRQPFSMSPARDLRPLTSPIRPPSPARFERSAIQPGLLPATAPRVAITSLPGRRAPSPMTRALSGPLRPIAGLRRP